MLTLSNIYHHVNKLQEIPVNCDDPIHFFDNFKSAVKALLDGCDVRKLKEEEVLPCLEDWTKTLAVINAKMTQLREQLKPGSLYDCLFVIRYHLMKKYINLIDLKRLYIFDETICETVYHRHLLSEVFQQGSPNYWRYIRTFISNYRVSRTELAQDLLKKLQKETDGFIGHFYNYMAFFNQLAKLAKDRIDPDIVHFIDEVLVALNTHYYFERGEEHFHYYQFKEQVGPHEIHVGHIKLTRPLRKKEETVKPAFLEDYHLKEKPVQRRLDIPKVKVSDIKVRVKKKRLYEVPTC